MPLNSTPPRLDLLARGVIRLAPAPLRQPERRWHSHWQRWVHRRGKLRPQAPRALRRRQKSWKPSQSRNRRNAVPAQREAATGPGTWRSIRPEAISAGIPPVARIAGTCLIPGRAEPREHSQPEAGQTLALGFARALRYALRLGHRRVHRGVRRDGGGVPASLRARDPSPPTIPGARYPA